MTVPDQPGDAAAPDDGAAPGASAAPDDAAPDELTNRVILDYGRLQATFVTHENRDRLDSPLFDLPRRSLIGYEIVYEHGPWLLREVQRYASAEQIGERMRDVAVRPGYLQLTMLPCGYLSARQLRLLAGGTDPATPVHDERPDDLAVVCRFTAEASASYRQVPVGVQPPPGGAPHPILDRAQVAELESQLAAATPGRIEAARRLSGTAAAYALLLHGEQRDGITGHGPYPSGSGRRLLFVEYTDLRGDFLPWAPAPGEVELDGLSFLYEVPDWVQVRHDPYGSLTVDPLDFLSVVGRLRVFARIGGELRALDDDRIAAARQALTDAQDGLYARIVEWPEAMRVRYGGWIFANHLHAFARAAGAPAELSAELAQRTQRTAASVHAQLSSRATMADLYRNVRSSDVPLFTPVA
jgi:hypothetical protein